MQDTIKFKVRTMSNLFIGGSPAPFEIGGVDQYTVTTHDGLPYIPGSSIKGVLRTIVRENNNEQSEEISKFYGTYLKNEKIKNWTDITKKYENDRDALNRVKERYESVKLTPECLFGIEGFNHTPRLFFSDLYLSEKSRKENNIFSIDAKNSIEENNGELSSNPRIYKTVCSGLTFEGEIRLYKMECLGENAVKLCKDYIKSCLEQFNGGIYRLGNSKSRGYGNVNIEIMEESGESGK